MEFPRSCSLAISCAKLPFLFFPRRSSSSSSTRRRGRPLKRFIGETRFSQDWMLFVIKKEEDRAQKKKELASQQCSQDACQVVERGGEEEEEDGKAAPAAAVFWPHYRISWYTPELRVECESPELHKRPSGGGRRHIMENYKNNIVFTGS